MESEICGDQSAYLYLVRNVSPLHGTGNLFAASDNQRTISPVFAKRAHQDLAHLRLGPAVDVKAAEKGVLGREADAITVAHKVLGWDFVDNGEEEVNVHSSISVLSKNSLGILQGGGVQCHAEDAWLDSAARGIRANPGGIGELVVH